MVEELIKAGAKVNLTDKQGKTSFFLLSTSLSVKLEEEQLRVYELAFQTN